jgi:integrase
MSALSYMQRRASGTYEFRRRLPDKLAGKPAPPHMRAAFSELINPETGCFKREVVRSLGTKDPKEAKRRNHQEAQRVGGLFDDAERALAGETRPATITEADLAEISREVVAELLQADEVEREEGDDRRLLQTEEDRRQWPDLVAPVPLAPNAPPPSLPAPHIKGMAEDHYLAYGVWNDEAEAEFREAYARRDPTIVNAETRTVLKRRGLSLDPAAPHYRQVGMAVLQGTVQAYELIRRKHAGEIIQPIYQPTPSPLAQHASPMPAPLVERGPKLSEAFAAWKVGGSAKGAKKPRENTVLEAEQAVRYFTELHGDLRIGEITREKARQFRDAAASVPRNLPAKLRRLPLPKLLEHDLSGYEQRSATTVHKLLTMLGAIVSKAEREGHLDKVHGFVNPFGKGIRFAIHQSELEREPFDKADLRAIFASEVFAGGMRPLGGGGEAAYWFPLIGLLSGMRLEEIAQLRICDLREDEETSRWFFDVARTGERSTKTVSSVRRVPIHRELERLGLLRYRQASLDGGETLDRPLWPDVKANGSRQRSSAWSKWFGRYLRERCGITDANKVFHSFRHTFKRMCRDVGLSEEVHDALTGHAGNGGVGRTYGKGFSIAPLIDAMDKIAAPINLESLCWMPNAGTTR